MSKFKSSLLPCSLPPHEGSSATAGSGSSKSICRSVRNRIQLTTESHQLDRLKSSPKRRSGFRAHRRQCSGSCRWVRLGVRQDPANCRHSMALEYNHPNGSFVGQPSGWLSLAHRYLSTPNCRSARCVLYGFFFIFYPSEKL